MSWLSWPNSSPMLRSCLSSGIPASQSALRARITAAGVATTGPRGLEFAGRAIVVEAILATAVPATLPAPLGALDEPRTDESQHQGTAQYHRGLPPGQVLHVVPHGRRVFVAKVSGNLIHLAGQRLGQTGEAGLLLGAEVLGGPPQSLGHGADLVGKLVLALA